ncbi:ribosome maturation factor RimP [Runella sp. MFBS21]|uniref:ribosome maturation factor RimP n=1 Tax=Runella sp. MFBS21 TaxID=3034018 RepID=UPI0023F73CE1|nr:ribosome maturation factor RimP [Runella sp. MFBS21]MDF7818141.1 ribosome maturation factor RimP [Runella sp. MFBS21]
MNLKEQIIGLLTPLLEDDKYFIVEIQVSPSKIRQKVTVLIDSDEGISIDECAEISRKLGDLIEEQAILPNAYILEVSSPGVDYPLSMPRQFRKNIGRTLKVILPEGIEKKGQLVSASEEGFVLLEELKKKKKDQVPNELSFAYADIVRVEVQIKF